MDQVTSFSEQDLQKLLSELSEIVGPLLAKLGAIFAIAAVIGLVVLLIDYILRSIAIARMGHRRGIPLWGLAWVPGLRLIVIGGIADYHDRKTVKRKHGFNVLLPVLLLINLIAVGLFAYLFKAQISRAVVAFSVSPESGLQALFSSSFGKWYSLLNLIACLSATLLTVFRNIAVYKVLEACKKKHTIVNMILYLIVPFAAPIVLLAVSGSDSDKKKAKLPPPEEMQEPEEI